MSPQSVSPPTVPAARVRRLPQQESQAPAGPEPVAVPVLPAPVLVPHQVDRVGQRLVALQQENEQLRAQLQQQRTA